MRNRTIKAKNSPNLWKECELCYGNYNYEDCYKCHGTGLSLPENISDEYRNDIIHWISSSWKATGLCFIKDETMEPLEEIKNEKLLWLSMPPWTMMPVSEPKPDIHSLKMVTLPKKATAKQIRQEVQANKSFLQQIKKFFIKNQSKFS
jgi:hypothetical protein